VAVALVAIVLGGSCPGHTHSQRGPRRSFSPKCLQHIAILCFDRQYPKQDSVICQKNKNFGLATLLVLGVNCPGDTCLVAVFQRAIALEPRGMGKKTSWVKKHLLYPQSTVFCTLKVINIFE